jgi:iron complex outermembrane receptor protein
VPFGIPTDIFNLWASQDLGAVGLGGFRLGGGVSHRSRVYADNPNTRRLPSYTLVDTVLSYDVDPRLQLSLGVYNLFDQAYFRTPVNTGALPGDPRTVFFRARVQL